jgi:hypothetical protein
MVEANGDVNFDALKGQADNLAVNGNIRHIRYSC